MSFKVGAKGQIVIDQEIREALGVEPGWTASQRLVEDHVEVRFFPPEHNRSLAGVLASYVKRTLTEEDWGEAKERAWAEAVAEGEATVEPLPATTGKLTTKPSKKLAKKTAKRPPKKRTPHG